MKKQAMFIFILTFLVLGIFAVELAWSAKRMPTFALENVRNGEIVNSSSFNGKVLLLTFFATWCPPCAEEVPVLMKLQDDLSESGFSVIGLSVDQQGRSMVASFVEKRSINYPVLLAKEQTTSDFGGVFGIPVAFLVNKNGNVVKKYMGYVQHAVLEKDIRSLLN